VSASPAPGWFAKLRARWRAPREPDEHWVCFASQTGNAEALALRTASTLEALGLRVRVLPLNWLAPSDLDACREAWFVVSTTGEGNAPDTAVQFVQHVMPHAFDLYKLRYSVLALGDRRYAKFCGFGRTLDAWLAGHNAEARFARIDVDAEDPEACARWEACVVGTIRPPR
jgi:sulfite reductase (NADPH) flavoprotein alpha-component